MLITCELIYPQSLLKTTKILIFVGYFFALKTIDLSMSDENKKNKYSAESIQALEGMEHVRKRPSMYIGDVGTRGLHLPALSAGGS